jgi:hypothetical protein
MAPFPPPFHSISASSVSSTFAEDLCAVIGLKIPNVPYTAIKHRDRGNQKIATLPMP